MCTYLDDNGEISTNVVVYAPRYGTDIPFICGETPSGDYWAELDNGDFVIVCDVMLGTVAPWH